MLPHFMQHHHAAAMLISSLALFLAVAVGVVSPQMKDAALKLSRALPASTAVVTAAAALRVGAETQLGTAGPGEFLLTAPALSTAELPDSKTMTYDIVHTDNADLSGPVALYPGVIKQTGAGGTGAAAATFRFKIPSNVKKYLLFQITPSASGTGDASAETATLEAVF